MSWQWMEQAIENPRLIMQEESSMSYWIENELSAAAWKSPWRHLLDENRW